MGLGIQLALTTTAPLLYGVPTSTTQGASLKFFLNVSASVQEGEVSFYDTLPDGSRILLTTANLVDGQARLDSEDPALPMNALRAGMHTFTVNFGSSGKNVSNSILHCIVAGIDVDADQDGDSLPDAWELRGGIDADGNGTERHLRLPQLAGLRGRRPCT